MGGVVPEDREEEPTAISGCAVEAAVPVRWLPPPCDDVFVDDFLEIGVLGVHFGENVIHARHFGFWKF